ncbi:hypothetical protein [Sphingomonas sp. AX6]|uniref:hypothetical protein n=1 Tax=Sphingomonas sp. AX6 TaxID=2653171 RepID=UPI001358B7E7|nr:hypothetical protein [Sphingomonas sp. AX6]
MTGFRSALHQPAGPSLLSQDTILRRSLTSSSDAHQRAQLRTRQQFLSPDAVAAAWDRLNTAKEGKWA